MPNVALGLPPLRKTPLLLDAGAGGANPPAGEVPPLGPGAGGAAPPQGVDVGAFGPASSGTVSTSSYNVGQAPGLPTYAPRDPGQFTGQAPAPTAYGAFGGINPATFERTPGSLYLQAQAQKAIQRQAAAGGSLMSGGLLKKLQENAVGLAAQDLQNAFGRDLATYTSNRDTNAQNYGQQMDQFQGNLGAFGANTNATLGFNAQAGNAAYGNYDRAYRAYTDALDRQPPPADTTPAVQVGAFGSAPSLPAQQAANEYAELIQRQRARAAGAGTGGLDLLVQPGQATARVGGGPYPYLTPRTRRPY